MTISFGNGSPKKCVVNCNTIIYTTVGYQSQLTAFYSKKVFIQNITEVII